jgi:DNA adenine methylase
MRPAKKNQAILTDINPELINTYCCVKESVEELILLLKEHQLRHSKDYYYQVRSQTNGLSIEKAARLIYLNKTCFNGLYRENSRGEFNVPIGRYKNPNICNADLLRSVSAALQSAKIEVKPFDAVLDYAKSSKDFVYFDPPYYPLSKTSNFTAYSRYSFSEDDQIRLRDTVAELARRGVNVMLSNSDCSFIRELYKDFNIHEILAARAINSNAQKRGKITELLVTSY